METERILEKFHAKKKRDLFLSLGVDLLGMASYVFPVLGELPDLIFAPVSGIVIYALYRKSSLKLKAGAAGLIGMTEEILPTTDIVPTATLMWFNTYVLGKDAALKQFVKERNTQLKTIKNS